MTARRFIIHGGVQGVGYRDWTVRTARRLGLTGWVRNRHDGSVEMVAQGDAAVLDELAKRCHAGPMMARVKDVQAEPWAEESLERFEERPSV